MLSSRIALWPSISQLSMNRSTEASRNIECVPDMVKIYGYIVECESLRNLNSINNDVVKKDCDVDLSSVS